MTKKTATLVTLSFLATVTLNFWYGRFEGIVQSHLSGNMPSPSLGFLEIPSPSKREHR